MVRSAGLLLLQLRGRFCQRVLIPLEIKRERTPYAGKEKEENQEIKRQCVAKETSESAIKLGGSNCALTMPLLPAKVPRC